MTSDHHHRPPALAGIVVGATAAAFIFVGAEAVAALLFDDTRWFSAARVACFIPALLVGARATIALSQRKGEP